MPSNDAQSQLQHLERFVTDNEELLKLEELIGRFNIFDALGIARRELQHSNFLAWLLDPAESHGQRSLFLNALLVDLIRRAPIGGRPLTAIDLDGADIRDVEIRREWESVDLLIVCRDPACIIVIENKVDSDEHSDQLKRYEDVVIQNFPEAKPLWVYLTPDGHEPSRSNWLPYSYVDIHRVLQRCRRTYEGSIGTDVGAFLDHYLRLIGSRFMENTEIDALCRRIYRNHRQALDLIFDRIGSLSTPILTEAEQIIEAQPACWKFLKRSKRELHFIPPDWLDALPAISAENVEDRRTWLHCGFSMDAKSIWVWCIAFPTADAEMRRRVVERLTANKDEFGLGRKFKKVTGVWTTLYWETVAQWPEDEMPDTEEVLQSLCAKLKQLEERWKRVPASIAEAAKDQVAS